MYELIQWSKHQHASKSHWTKFHRTGTAVKPCSDSIDIIAKEMLNTNYSMFEALYSLVTEIRNVLYKTFRKAARSVPWKRMRWLMGWK